VQSANSSGAEDGEVPGVLMLDLDGLALSDEESQLLRHPQVGALILFSRNFKDLDQLRALISDIRAVRPGILIAVDQEGGRVQRLREGFTRLPPMNCFQLHWNSVAGSGEALTLARDCGWLMAAEVLSCGIDFSFAPVLDLETGCSEVIGNRAFAPDPVRVSALASAFMLGMHDAGMATTGKHFPGHGSVAADSHLALPVDERDLQTIKEQDLQPFARCIDALDAVMPAHIVYSQVDQVCAGFSRIWLQDILRGELGFEGVIFSDDLSMAGAAAAGTIAQRVDAALDAGCDMVLVCNDRAAALAALAHLEQRQQPANPRLLNMRRRREWNREELLGSEDWQRVSRSIAELSE
jgi:beta-N-acetylhexosaminidase